MTVVTNGIEGQLAIGETPRAHSSISYFNLNADGVICEVNQTALRRFGNDRSQLPGLPFQTLVAMVDRRLFNNLITKVFSSGTEQRCELAMEYDGHSPAIVQLEAMPSQNGQECRILLFDLAERKPIEQSRIRREERFHEIIDASPVPMALNDDQQHITYLNPAFIQTYGYTLEDIPTLSHWWPKAYPDPEYRQFVTNSWQAQLESMKQTGGPFAPFELTIKSKDGTDRTALASASMLSEAFEGEHLVILYDITSRKQTEETLRQSQKRLQLIFESTTEGLILLSADGQIIELNPSAQRILGMTTEQMCEDNPANRKWHLFDEKGASISVDNLLVRGMIGTDLFLRDVVMGVQKTNGTRIWISVSSEPLFDSHDRVSMIVISISDITANKNIQDALIKSEARFSQIFRSIPTMMAISTASEAIMVDWNPYCSSKMGFTAEEILGHRAADLGIWPNPEQRESLIAALRRGETVRNIECVIRAKSGRLYTVLTCVEPIEFGGERCFLFIHHDISDRKRIEESLRESEERYRMLVDNAPAGVYVTHENKFVYVNDAMSRMMGANSKDDLLGTYVLDRIPPELLPAVLAPIERVLVNGEPAPLMENRYLRLDGSVIDVETLAIPIQFDHQPAIQVVINDVTERKRAQKLLRATETRLATIFSSSPVGMCITSMLDGRVLEVNNACCEISGFRREDVLDRKSTELGYWLDINERNSLVQTLIEHGSLKNDEFAFRRHNGTIGYALRSLERLVLDGQDCILSMFIDITDRKQIDEELRASRQRLEMLSRQLIMTQETERHHLARELHDEIGQVLTAIKMNLRRAQRAADETMKSHLQDTFELIDQAIVQVRSISLRLRPPQLDDLGLVAALHWLIKQQALLGEFEEQLEIDLGDIQIPADLETVCFRIAQEALTNAIRHAQPGKIQIKLLATAADVELTIHDDGNGFDVSAASALAAKGNSLGLISMQERTYLAGGRIAIKSSPEEGTTIHVWLPLDRS